MDRPAPTGFALAVNYPWLHYVEDFAVCPLLIFAPLRVKLHVLFRNTLKCRSR